MSACSLRINTLAKLGEYILSRPIELDEIITVAGHHNGWFDSKNCWDSLESIANNYLQTDKLEAFVANYPELINVQTKRIALILAGNIPLVGFHDILCVYLSGHIAAIKLSSKDNVLTKAIIMKLRSLNDQFAHQLTIVEDRLTDFDAVIATGSDNTSRYFEEYFGQYPNIIRKNRNSIGVLTGQESEDELQALGLDVFTHYGLGCRNVSLLFVPNDYDFQPLLDQLATVHWVIQNKKYRNNYDYNLSILLINRIPILQTDNVLLTENESMHSRIATVHFTTYDQADEVSDYIIDHSKQIQVVVGKDYVPFGQAQNPQLTDYADQVDTMQFLISL